MEEIGKRKLQNSFDQCDFMTKGAEGCRKNSIYKLKLDKKVFLLCKPCIENCQHHPEYDEGNLVEDMGDEFVCECALEDHNLKFKKGDNEIEGYEIKAVANNTPCPFSDTLIKISSDSFFRTSDNQNLCLFCYFDFSEQNQTSEFNKKKVASAVFSDDKSCSCNSVGCDHSLGSTIIKFKTCFRYVISPLEDEKFLGMFFKASELIFFFYNYPIFGRFFDSYFKEVINASYTKQYPIEYLDFEQKNEEFKVFKDEEAIWTYINDFFIINTNINILIWDRPEINLSESLFANTINLNTLLELLDSKVKRSEFTFFAQLAALNIFFNTFLFPNVKKHTSIYFSNDLNLSPLHRLMFFNTDHEFLKSISEKNGRTNFFNLIKKTISIVTQIHEDRDLSILTRIKDIKHLVLVLIKYLSIFGYFTLTKDSLIYEYACVINDLAKIIYFLMNNSKTAPIGIEPNSLIYVYNYLKDEKKFDQEEKYDTYLPINVIRLRFEKLIKVLMIKQNDLMFKKAFLDHDDIGAFNLETLNFTFENHLTSRKLFGGLLEMGYQKNDGSGDERGHMEDLERPQDFKYINSINDAEISQILFHEDDCYISGLKALCQCYVVEKMPPNIMKDIMLERDSNYFIPKNLKNIFGHFDIDTKDYFRLRITNQDYCNQIGSNCKEAILILLPLLNLEINPVTSELSQVPKTNFEKNFELQFIFAKNKYLESLMRLIEILTKVRLKVILYLYKLFIYNIYLLF